MKLKLEELKNRLDYQTLLLAGFSLLASGLLGLGDFATEGAIEQRHQEDLKESLEEVIPVDLYDNKLLEDIALIDSSNDHIGSAETEVYVARKAGRVTAASYRLIAPEGYSGNIYLIMGVDRNGEVLGVRVLSHAETPGLGDKIEVAKSDWILSFNGNSLENLGPDQWAVKKDGGKFDQFSGATITPRAIVNAVVSGLEFFKNHKAEIVGELD